MVLFELGKHLRLCGLRTVDAVYCRYHSLDAHKVKSLSVDVSHLANGAIPEPIFSGELSVLSPVDPHDERKWVCVFVLDS